MRLEKLSNNFTPLRQGLFFGIETEEAAPTNVLVEIIDDVTEEIVATQQLRGITAGEVNIAPYIPVSGGYSPAITPHSHLREAPVATYRIRVGEVESAPITVSVNNELPATLPAIISAMPHSRTISRNESDELLLLGEEGAIYTARIVADTGEVLSLETTSVTGATILSISTEDFGTDIRTLDLELSCEGVSLGSLHYTLRPRYNSSVRVAWLSHKGSTERYTFPVTSKVQCASQRGVVEKLDKQQVASISSVCDITLVSRYESHDTIQALAEIICSPKVWMEEGGVWSEVVVTSPTLDYNLFGELDSMSINIRKWSNKEGAL